MSKIIQNWNVSNIPTVEQFQRFMAIILDDVFPTINGLLEFDQNLKTSTVDANFTAANTELAISHGLQRPPTGYILAKSNVATSIYDGTTSNSDSTIYLKSSAIASTKIIVF